MLKLSFELNYKLNAIDSNLLPFQFVVNLHVRVNVNSEVGN